VPGYKNFQLPQPPEYFTNLAERGPLVAFNITEKRSDAFIVTKADIRVIPLPKLKLADLISNVALLLGDSRITSGPDSDIHQRNKQLLEILKWLWKVAVRPVLQDLGFLIPKAQGPLPRIWWVTAGLMGLAPLHAAGYKWGKGTNNTASCVVSSYIPTFKALEYARKRTPESIPWHDQRFLAVLMPQTTGFPHLEVTAEMPDIRRSVERIGMKEIKIPLCPSKDEVLEKLQNCTVLHFSCHGKSDPVDPSDCRLFLADGPDDKPECLTVRDLSRASLHMAQMAYLSACSTAENAASALLDEGIHVASAFLLVGFPHVIGTLWEANSEAAMHVSRRFYAELADLKNHTGLETQDVFAYAMHKAVNCLRSGAVDSTRRKRNASDNVTAWAPFIHLGC